MCTEDRAVCQVENLLCFRRGKMSLKKSHELLFTIYLLFIGEAEGDKDCVKGISEVVFPRRFLWESSI